MKHKPEVYSGRQLINRIMDHEQIADHDFSSVIGDDDEPIESAYDQFFVVCWPEHCITRHSLGDASIHGPYESESEAMSCHDGAELY